MYRKILFFEVVLNIVSYMPDISVEITEKNSVHICRIVGQTLQEKKTQWNLSNFGHTDEADKSKHSIRISLK